MAEKAFTELCNVDGCVGRSIIPFPHDPHHNPDSKKWENVSIAQRIEQVQSKLTADETDILRAFLSSIVGSSMEAAGMFDVLRWWALGGYTMEGLYETGDDFKLLTGQSSFSLRFLDESLQTGNLQYSFNTAVLSVQDLGDKVVVNDTWTAKRAVCTIPLNVLPHVRFEPMLDHSKIEATRHGNINHGAKVHLEASGTDLRSWSGTSWPPARLFNASGDGLTPAGNAHIVCFGANAPALGPSEDAHDFVADVQRVQNMDVKKIVSCYQRQ